MIRVRDRINSVAGAADESHGMPFVLGRPLRVPRNVYIYNTYVGNGTDELRVVPKMRADVRIWLACVRLPDGTWRHDYAFNDSEVFETLP